MIEQKFIDKIEDLRHHTYSRITEIQKNLCPMVKSIYLNYQYEYWYEGYKYPQWEDNIQIYSVKDIPYCYDNELRNTTFQGTLDELVTNAKVWPFLLFIDGVVIQWSKITVIRDYNYSYLRIEGITPKKSVQANMIVFPIMGSNIRYGEDNDVLVTPDRKGFYFGKDGKRLESTDFVDISLRLEILDSNIYYKEVNIFDLTDTLEFTDLPDGYLPTLDNIITFTNDGSYNHMGPSLKLSDIYKSSYGLFNVLAGNNNIKWAILMYNTKDNNKAASYLYSKSEDLNKAAITKLLIESPKDISAEIWQDIITPLIQTFDFEYSYTKDYDTNTHDAAKYITRYDFNLWKDTFIKDTNIQSYTYTGEEFKNLADDTGYVHYSRKHSILIEDMCIVFVNHKIYDYMIDVTYSTNTINIPIFGMYDDDHIEIVLYNECNNNVLDITVPDSSTAVYIHPEYNLEDCDIMSTECPDAVYDLPTRLDKRTQFIVDRTYTVDENYNYKISFTKPYYYGKTLKIVPKKQFRYYRFKNNEGKSSFVLPTIFNYCHDPDRYLVFINGKKIDRTEYTITITNEDRPFDKLILYVSTILDEGDYIDIFYVPEAMVEKYKKDSMPKSGLLLLEDEDDNINYPTTYPLSKYTTMIFINGLKVNPLDIKDVSLNCLLIGVDKYERNADGTIKRDDSGDPIIKRSYVDSINNITIDEIIPGNKEIAGYLKGLYEQIPSGQEYDPSIIDFNKYASDSWKDLIKTLLEKYAEGGVQYAGLQKLFGNIYELEDPAEDYKTNFANLRTILYDIIIEHYLHNDNGTTGDKIVYDFERDYFEPNTIPDAKDVVKIINLMPDKDKFYDYEPDDSEPEAPYLCFTAQEPNSTISMSIDSESNSDIPTLSYSFDNATWVTFIPGTTVITLAGTGNFVYIKGNNTTISSEDVTYSFVLTGKLAASGNIMSLLDEKCSSTTISNGYCFYRLFYNCSTLTSAPTLPATTLSNQCYMQMFSGCTSLASAPELPATTLTAGCYGYMFQSCTTLVTTPALPATTLANGCYGYMFAGCTALTTAPELPVTTLADSCYHSMFSNCTALTTAPALPATTLAEGCYAYMFKGCSSLVTAPELPATTLIQDCYPYMFYGCTSLTVVPELPATTLAYRSYAAMFYGCTALYISDIEGINEWKIPSTGIGSGDYTMSNMFKNCLGTRSSDSPNFNGIQKTYYRQSIPLCFTANTANSSVEMRVIGTPSCNQSFEISTNGIDWTVFTPGTDIITLTNVGDKAYFRGDNITVSESDNMFYKFVMTGSIAGSGNIMSLLDETCESTTINHEYCFIYLFNNCTALVSAPKLPATTLSTGCYYAMFAGCTALTNSPTLPSTVLANSCYRSMFDGCTSLTTVPTLSATSMMPNCYYAMFSNCTALTTTPILSAITLANKCYQYMFSGCTSLTTPPELPATTLAESCYAFMFADCINLLATPTLSAIILVKGCYASMFSGCTALTTTSALPATSLSYICYYGMFDSCTSLTTAPVLPATTLAESCYSNMFANCTSLTVAPELPANILAKACYQSMFMSCIALTDVPNEISAETMFDSSCEDMFANCVSITKTPYLATGILSTNCYKNMFSGCSSLVKVSVLFPKIMASNCYSGMFSGCTTLYVSDIEGPYQWNIPLNDIGTGNYTMTDMFKNCLGTRSTDSPNFDNIQKTYYIQNTPIKYNYLCFTANTANSTVAMSIITGATPTKGQSFEYSTDKTTWNTFTPDTTTVTLSNIGDKVYIRGNNVTVSESSGAIYSFIMTGSIAASGNIMSLLDETCESTISSGQCFYKLFYGCTSLTTAPELPATTLAAGCYMGMFGDCTSLTTAPELPATTLAYGCYAGMFDGCTSLTTAPELPATTLVDHCYDGMFGDCTSLTTTPTLPATTLVDHCYSGMFDGCTSLTTAPELPATTLAYYCYQSMFSGCTSLTTTPTLPATTLANYCYRSMFNNCQSLTTAPALPATTLAYYCYDSMFEGCTSLTTAPELPAITLASSCYQSMFEGCTSLTTAPELPATTLASYCYWYMFSDCTSLYISDAGINEWKVPSTGVGSGNYTQTLMFKNCLGTRSTDSPNFNGIQKTYYTQQHEPIAYAGLCFTANTAGSTVGMSITGARTKSQSFEYSTDGAAWFTFTPGTTTVTLSNIGDKVYIRGDNTTVSESNSIYYRFVMTGSIAGSGNIMSLLDKTCESTTISNSYCFYNLFYNCTSLTTAPELPATNLTGGCYSNMFRGCTSLITAPELPATTLVSGCYQYMFHNCTSLTTAPKLPATTLQIWCYQLMFYGCKSLTTAPELPATTLASSCYQQMFSGCTSLYVSDTSGTGYDKEWIIPKNGVCSGNYTMSNMFYGCLGTRSSNSPKFKGIQKIYYTQNTPV